MAGFKSSGGFIFRKMTLLIIVLFLFPAQSCDCWSTLNLDVKNVSNGPIKVIVTAISGDKNVYTIPVQSSTTIYTATGPRCKCQKCLGQAFSDTNVIALFISNIEVMRSDSTVSKTNFNQNKNWVFESQKDISIYTATVKQTDF